MNLNENIRHYYLGVSVKILLILAIGFLTQTCSWAQNSTPNSSSTWEQQQEANFNILEQALNNANRVLLANYKAVRNFFNHPCNNELKKAGFDLSYIVYHFIKVYQKNIPAIIKAAQEYCSSSSPTSEDMINCQDQKKFFEQFLQTCKVPSDLVKIYVPPYLTPNDYVKQYLKLM